MREILLGELQLNSLNYEEDEARIEASTSVQPYFANRIDRDRWNEIWHEKARKENIGYWNPAGEEKRVFFSFGRTEGTEEHLYESANRVAEKMAKLTKEYFESAQRYNGAVADFIAERRALVDRALDNSDYR